LLHYNQDQANWGFTRQSWWRESFFRLVCQYEHPYPLLNGGLPRSLSLAAVLFTWALAPVSIAFA